MNLRPKNAFERELETKLDVPLYIKPENVINQIRSTLRTKGWKKSSERVDEKDLLYYDTEDLDFYHFGKTLRRVTPFDPTKFPGGIRYDFKQGKGIEREEHKEWSKVPLQGYEILSLLGLTSVVGSIYPQFEVHIHPHFLDLERGESSIELKLDTCSYLGIYLFRELELELKSGNPETIFELSALLSTEFEFPFLHEQKYSRARDSILGAASR